MEISQEHRMATILNTTKAKDYPYNVHLLVAMCPNLSPANFQFPIFIFTLPAMLNIPQSFFLLKPEMSKFQEVTFEWHRKYLKVCFGPNLKSRRAELCKPCFPIHLRGTEAKQPLKAPYICSTSTPESPILFSLYDQPCPRYLHTLLNFRYIFVVNFKRSG